MEVLFYVLTGAGGLSGVASIVICWLVYRQLQTDAESRKADSIERQRLIDSVRRLENEKIAKIEHDLAEHLRSDNPEKINSEMGKLTGEVKRLIDKIDADRTAAETEFRSIAGKIGEFSGVMSGIKTWLGNINTDFQSHVNNRGLHGN